MATKNDVESLNEHVDKHVTTVNEILEKFKEYLETEVEARKTVEKQVGEVRRNMTYLKGRTGSLEAKYKSIEADVEKLELEQSDQIYDSHFIESKKVDAAGPATFFQDTVEKLENQINMTQMEVRELSDNVQARGIAVRELQTAFTSKHKDTTDGWVTRSNESSSLSAHASMQVSFLQSHMVSHIPDDLLLIVLRRDFRENMLIAVILG